MIPSRGLRRDTRWSRMRLIALHDLAAINNKIKESSATLDYRAGFCKRGLNDWSFFKGAFSELNYYLLYEYIMSSLERVTNVWNEWHV